MPRRTYVRIENGVPVFPIARDAPVLPQGGVGSLVRGPNGVVLGRMTSESQSGSTVVAPRTMMTGMVGSLRIGTSALMPGEMSRALFRLGDPEPEPEDDPSGVAEDFRLMHGESDGPSALDHLLEDDDDPIPTG